jgi:hypothetical protein
MHSLLEEVIHIIFGPLQHIYASAHLDKLREVELKHRYALEVKN